MIKCTIAIPVFNREKLIRRAVESALEQDLSGLEILVVDNCSTDRTWDVLNSYHDPRLRLLRNENNIGLFGNFNRTLGLAQGQYLRFLCSDDRLAAGCLKHEIAIMDAHSDVVLLSTQGLRVDEDGYILGKQADHFPDGIYNGSKAIHAVLWFQSHYAYNPLNYPSGVLIRRDAAKQAGQFDTSMKMSGDVDYFLRILQHGNLAILNDIGCEIMIHTNQEGSTLSGDTAPILELYGLVERYHDLLQREGSYCRIKQQLAAYSFGLAFKFWRLNLKPACQAHFDIAKYNSVSWTKSIQAIIRLLIFRFVLKSTGIRMMPVSRLMPID